VVDATTVRAVTSDGHVRDLDLSSGAWTDVLSLGDTSAVAISADARVFARLSGATITIDDLAGSPRVEVQLPDGPLNRIRRLAWNSDATRLAVAEFGNLRIFARDGTPIAQAPVDIMQSCRLAWHAPDAIFLIADLDIGIHCRLDGGEIRVAARKILSGGSVHFTGGRWVVPALNGAVQVTEKGGPELFPAEESGLAMILTRHRDMATFAEASPDGSILATCGVDGTVRLWSLESGTGITTFTPHTQSVAWLGWLPDGSGIVSIGQFGETRFLDSVPRAARIAADAQRSTANPRPAYGQ
jgi:WD40 repeat protein